MDDSTPDNEGPSRKLLSTGALMGAILLSLLGGLALVVRSLRNVDLTLLLNLKRDDKAKRGLRLWP
jgi:hypothetical protein